MDIDFTEKLIQEVRNRPIIYLISHPDYKNNTKKLQAWREIQRILNEDVPTLKAKWKNLKDSYKKFKQSKRTSTGQAAKKLQNWTWADHMSFIEPSISLNETESSMAPLNEDHPINISVTNSQPVDQPVDPASQPVVASGSRQETSQTQNAQQIYRRHRQHNLDPTERMIEYLQNRQRTRNSNDERVDMKCDGTDLIFLGYADTFKKLSKRKQVTVKFDIAKILMEAELDDLITPENRSPSSGTSFINAASPENYIAPLTPGNYSMISDATINDTQESREYILPVHPTDLTVNNVNFNSANSADNNYTNVNNNTCSRFFSQFQ